MGQTREHVGPERRPHRVALRREAPDRLVGVAYTPPRIRTTGWCPPDISTNFRARVRTPPLRETSWESFGRSWNLVSMEVVRGEGVLIFRAVPSDPSSPPPPPPLLPMVLEFLFPCPSISYRTVTKSVQMGKTQILRNPTVCLFVFVSIALGDEDRRRLVNVMRWRKVFQQLLQDSNCAFSIPTRDPVRYGTVPSLL